MVQAKLTQRSTKIRKKTLEIYHVNVDMEIHIFRVFVRKTFTMTDRNLKKFQNLDSIHHTAPQQIRLLAAAGMDIGDREAHKWHRPTLANRQRGREQGADDADFKALQDRERSRRDREPLEPPVMS